ncbi:MAG: M23 family metallopeptidase [Pseudomonadota bacterium]
MIKILCNNCESIHLAYESEFSKCPNCNIKLRLKRSIFKGHFIGEKITSSFSMGTLVTNIGVLEPSLVEKISKTGIYEKEAVNKLKKFMHSYQAIFGLILLLVGVLMISHSFGFFNTNNDQSIVSSKVSQKSDDQDVLSIMGEYLELNLAPLKLNEKVTNKHFIDLENKDSSIKNNKLVLAGEALQMPLKGAKPSSHFGMRNHPIDGKRKMHTGIDIPRRMHSEIKAAMSGKVIFSGSQDGYGNVIVVEHKKGYSTLYGHNSKNNVKAGEIIKQGQTIGIVGSSGNSTGPHLHFELRKDGKYLDPMNYLKTGKF